jgi:hypothetical protein
MSAWSVTTVLAAALLFPTQAGAGTSKTVLRGTVHGTVWTLRASIGAQPCVTLRVGVNREAPASKVEGHECFDDFLLVGAAVVDRCRAQQKWLYGVAPVRTRRVVLITAHSRQAAAVSRRVGGGVFWSAFVPGGVTRLRVAARGPTGQTLDIATVGTGERCKA